MKERSIFIGIIIVALISMGIVAYRSLESGRSFSVPRPAETTSPTAGSTVAKQVSDGSIDEPMPVPVPLGKAVAAVPSVDYVRYDGVAFNPKQSVVESGTTIMFVNESNVDMWVASNPHPTHTDYSGFDALQAIKPGRSYSFKFTKIGTWGYHNHLDPSQTGTVMVFQN